MATKAMSKLRCQEAAQRAESLVKELGVNELPVDPFAIAEREGITVKPKESNEPGVSGFFLKVGDTFGIMYATHLSNDGFIRFTVAHELGHYFLPGHTEHLFSSGKEYHSSRSGFVSNDAYEKEADHFAASLLMPHRLFLPALRRAGEGLAAVKSLASQCKTSLTSTAIRFAQLAEDPVAVVASTGDRIDYCFMSDPLRNIRMPWINKGDAVPAGTATSRFNGDPSNIGEVEGDTRLDEWIDGAPALEMREDVIGLGGYGKTLTVLFTDEAIEPGDEWD